MTDPISFIAALRRSWRLLIALAVLAGVVALFVPVGSTAKATSEPFRWKTTAIVGAPPSSSTGSVIGTAVSPAQILFYAESFFVKEAAVIQAKVPKSSQLATVARMSAGYGTSNSAKSSSKSSSKNHSSLITLASSGPSRTQSAAVTNAYATALGNALTAQAVAHQAAAAKSQSNSKSQPSDATPNTGYLVLSPALASQAKNTVVHTSKLTSSRKVRLVIGLVIGLVVGALIVLVLELLDKRMRKPARAEAHFRYPVVAEIPASAAIVGGQLDRPIVVATEPTSSAAEAYRKLRMAILFEGLATWGAVGNKDFGDPYASGSYPPTMAPFEPYKQPEVGTRQVILVVSPANEETRSLVVANLGATFAEAGQRAIVISTGDLGSGPDLSGDGNNTGTVSPADIESQLQTSSLENVAMLSLRPFVANSGALVTRAGPVLEAVRQLADVVIVEAPPLLSFHHAQALVHAVDVVLVVGECGSSTVTDADRAGDLLRRLGSPVLGVVFTNVPPPKRGGRHQLQPESPAGEAEPPAVVPATPDLHLAEKQA
jgi:Mrp family chromosome partitioning ATPase/capsular polysaccharide biosynthesis protein